MKKILATAYAVNPYKGSEDGMGWNFICQIARNHAVTAVTRKNNREAIEQFQEENPSALYQNIQFVYFDLPYWMRFWKKKERGAMLYFFLWQFFMPLFIWSEKIEFDLAHNLNFHTDWIPTFLWVLGRPTVWGPIGHHPKLRKEYIQPIYGKKAYLKSQIKWWIKTLNWNYNFLLRLSVLFCAKVIVMSNKAENVLNIPKRKETMMPSVGTELVARKHSSQKEGFQLLIVGRMVPLKGFDIAIESFAKFYHKLSVREQKNTRLHLVGKGPYKDKLIQLSEDANIANAVCFIDWMERPALNQLYQQASIFLFPSFEGAGMVVAEAMSHSLPVVCFDNCGPGAFVNNSCGRKIPMYHHRELSIQHFADTLNELSADKELRLNLSQGAFQRFEEYFHWDNKGRQLDELYQEILQKASFSETVLTFS
jgi:glycosyltransferase involved in cell wall biosynthesis